VAMRSGDNGSRTYLYGIASGEVPSRFPGLAAVANRDAPIRRLQAGGLSAIVSDAPDREIEATRDNLVAHSDAIQHILERASSVLPLRFGTVFPSDDAIRSELLEPRVGELGALLAAVEGCVEMRVKGFYDPDAVLREIVAEDRRVAELQLRTRSLSEDATYYERIQLGELVASALAAKRERDASMILGRLAPLTLDRVVEEEPHEWSVFTASLLVERRRLPELESALDAIVEAEAMRERLRLTCIGPLAPYSFANLAFEPAGAA